MNKIENITARMTQAILLGKRICIIIKKKRGYIVVSYGDYATSLATFPAAFLNEQFPDADYFSEITAQQALTLVEDHADRMLPIKREYFHRQYLSGWKTIPKILMPEEHR